MCSGLELCAHLWHCLRVSWVFYAGGFSFPLSSPCPNSCLSDGVWGGTTGCSLHKGRAALQRGNSVASGGVSPTDTEHARYHRDSWFVTSVDPRMAWKVLVIVGPAHLFLMPAEDSKEASIPETLNCVRSEHCLSAHPTRKDKGALGCRRGMPEMGIWESGPAFPSSPPWYGSSPIP